MWREDDDLVDAGRLERLDGAADVLGHLDELDVVAGRGDLGRVFGGRADDADLFAADVEDVGALDLAAQEVGARDVEVAADDREVGGLDELGEFLRAVVELVVAGRDDVKAHLVHEVGDDLGLVGRVVERALEIVARRQQDRRRAGGFRGGALGVDRGLQPRDAAEAFARGLALGVAVGVGAGDRLEAAVEIVDVQDVEGEFGKGRAGKAGARGERGGAQQQSFHRSLSSVRCAGCPAATVMRPLYDGRFAAACSPLTSSQAARAEAVETRTGRGESLVSARREQDRVHVFSTDWGRMICAVSGPAPSGFPTPGADRARAVLWPRRGRSAATLSSASSVVGGQRRRSASSSSRR